MIVFKPAFSTTVKYLITSFVFILIFSLFSKHGFSWGSTILLLLGGLLAVFFLENRVTKIEIDKTNHVLHLHYSRLWTSDVLTFSLSDIEVFFVRIPGARGMKEQVLRFKSADDVFDMKYGFNGWSEGKLTEIKKLIDDNAELTN